MKDVVLKRLSITALALSTALAGSLAALAQTATVPAPDPSVVLSPDVMAPLIDQLAAPTDPTVPPADAVQADPALAAPAEQAAPAVEAEPQLAAPADPAFPPLDAAGALEPATGLGAPQQAAPDAGAFTPTVVISHSLPEAIGAALAADQGALSFTEKKRLAAVAEFYAERRNAPVWIVDGRFTEAARAVSERIARAGEDGLDASAYALPDLALPPDLSLDAVAAQEIGLSLAVVAFSQDASGGRVQPARIAPDITRTPTPVDPIAALAQVADASDPAAVLDGFDPPHEGFRRLKAKLAEVRGRGESAPKPDPIPTGASLKPGMSDVRVAALRARLGLAPAADPALADVYDDAVVAAMKTFQAENGLLADGVVGSRTLGVLNGADRDEVRQILANMEMWRWMPRDLGRDYVFVNIPEFMVRVVRDGVQVHEARVVVGKVANPTPVFSDEMEYLVVNPYWHVPESIKTKEMLPEIKADPAGYFRRHGYEVTWEGEVIDPSRVVWDENAMRAVGIRQLPGEANALGNIKFMFPNSHSVYLHDTPSRKLFQRDVRAFSHGCVRVDDPMKFAEAVLAGDPQWTVPQLEAMFGGSERRVNLASRLRVHLAYFNVWVDDAGRLQIRDDLYGHTAKVKKALGL